MMKTTSTKKVGSIPVNEPVSKAKIAPGTCFVALPTPKEINSKWCAATKAKVRATKLDSGENSHVERFAQIMERMHATKKSFNFSDLVYIARGAEMEMPEIRRLWESWKTFAVQHCIVEVIQGCMDEETIIFNF
jgi:hypothetical protein